MNLNSLENNICFFEFRRTSKPETKWRAGSTEINVNALTRLTEPQRVSFTIPSKGVARNVMEGGSTEINVKVLIHLTEPQGIIKICLKKPKKPHRLV